jgi:hypothetical protein
VVKIAARSSAGDQAERIRYLGELQGIQFSDEIAVRLLAGEFVQSFRDGQFVRRQREFFCEIAKGALVNFSSTELLR